jgi:hypothetical protein
MSIPQPQQPTEPVKPLGPAIKRPEQIPGWRIHKRVPGYTIWAKTENGVERLWVVPTGV